MAKASYEECALELAPGIHASARLRRGGEGGERAMLVILRGGIDRKKRVVPAFRNFLPDFPQITQLAIADPTLERFDGIPAGWYLGWKGERLWQGLSDAIKAKAVELGMERVLYVGGSAGGFAALLLSHLHPESIAVVHVPQVDVTAHVYPRAWREYKDAAWDGEEPPPEVPTQLGGLYSRSMPNRVIFLQSPGDGKHLHIHAAPLLAAIAPQDQTRLVFDCRYHGIPKHSGAVPNPALTDWIQSALEVDPNETDWRDAILTRHYLRNQVPVREGRSQAAPRQPSREADIAMAARLARLELSAS